MVQEEGQEIKDCLLEQDKKAKKMAPIVYFNRYTQSLEEEPIVGEPFLRWAYGTKSGSLCVEGIFKRILFSRAYGWFMDTSFSKRKIGPFVTRYNIALEEAQKSPHLFTSFNDFFARQLKPNARPHNSNASAVVFPADGRHMGFENLNETQSFLVKEKTFNLSQLFNGHSIFKNYKEGTLVISRLCPFDYHRFHFPYAGLPSDPIAIQGPLYSVNPLALKKSFKILCENYRMLTLLESDQLGTVVLFEVGATCVGSIVQNFVPKKHVTKFEEKGFFKFGGSTVLTLFEKGKIRLDQDLLQQTQNGLELYARAGDSMAHVV